MLLFVRVKGYKLGKHILKIPCSIPVFLQTFFYILYIFKHSIRISSHIYSIGVKFKSVLVICLIIV